MPRIKKVKLTDVPLDSIYPYENNPRNNTDAVKAVAGSLDSFGYVKTSIAVDEDRVFLCGHTTYAAIKSLAWGTVPEVDQVFGLTDAEKRAYRIADNKLGEVATWDLEMLESEMATLKDMDFDIDLTGFDEDELKEATDEMFSLEDFEFEDAETPCWFVIRGDLKDYPELLHKINEAVAEFEVTVEDSQDG